MSIAPASPASARDARPQQGSAPRVRHQARDAATLMAFSALTSAGVALGFLLLAIAARQA